MAVEAVDSTFAVDKFLLAGEKRVTRTANFNFNFVESGTGGKFVATGTDNLAVGIIFRMNSWFHREYYSKNLSRKFVKL